ncbi:MAG: hypothetical protein ACOX45_10085 [Acutalibacteraceae bacterium]
MKKVILILLIVFVVTLTGCFAKAYGNDLTGLLSRINEAYGSEVIEPEGFAFDEDESRMWGFISCGESEFLLSANLDEKHRLTSCHTVFGSIAASQNESVKIFLPILFSSFTGESIQTCETVLNNLNVFSNTKALLNEKESETEAAKYIYTATTAGVVISCELKQTSGTSLTSFEPRETVN